MNAVLEYINWMGKGFVGFAGPMLLQSSVLIIILLIVDLLLRKKVRAVFRYWLWMLVLAKLVLPISLFVAGEHRTLGRERIAEC
jgi:beta-lactamase regulating signal transducer with metallopeptidase domain